MSKTHFQSKSAPQMRVWFKAAEKNLNTKQNLPNIDFGVLER